MKMWIKDPKTGESSVTLTMFVIGFIIATIKLLLSGILIGDVHLQPFTGGEFAAAVTALGAIYALRKHTDSQKKD